MVKRLFAGVVLLGLFSLVIYNLIQTDQNATDKDGKDNLIEYDQSEATPIKPPNAPEGIKVNEAAPDFELETLNGKSVKLSDFRGKKVFLNFWATWCPPCRVEMPEMQEFHEKYGDEVTIIAVNATGTEKNIQQVKDFVEKNDYTFEILLDRNMKVNNRYQAISIPTTYFIGTDGIIQIPRKIGPMNMELMIDNMRNLQ